VYLLAQCGEGLGLIAKGQNTRMLVSVVTLREPKMLRGSSRSGHGACRFLRHGHITLPAYRADLTYRVIPTEQDKSVSLPTRESTSQDGPTAVRT